MNVYVVYCHPLTDSFTGAVRDRALAGLNASGHEVRVTDLYADAFDPALTRDELARYADEPATKPDIVGYADLLRWCETLIFVYPTWWSGQPAMLKGWFDRVWVPGVAFEPPHGGGRIRPKLRNIKRVVAITSHGSSKLVNAVEGEAGKRVVRRSIRLMCSRATRTMWLALYGIDRTSVEQRQAFLDRVERRMRRL